MATVKCPDCGKEVSDRANVCIHCGAPLNFSVKNGVVKIKCCQIDGNPYKVTVANSQTGEVLAKVPQRGVVTFEIKKTTTVDIKYPLLRTETIKIPFNGTHCYEIVIANSFLWPKLQVNEVTNIVND